MLYNVVETENHYLLTFPKYYNLRMKYIKIYYYTWPSLHKLTKLISLNQIVLYKAYQNLYSL